MKKIDFILLIDDDDADNEYHEMILKNEGVASKLKFITNSPKALEYFRRCFAGESPEEYPVPDLVFLDINMPALNGFEMLDKYRELPDPKQLKAGIKIFMLTGSVNPEDQRRAEEEYGDLVSGYRIKPLTDTSFLKIIQEHFGVEFR